MKRKNYSNHILTFLSLSAVLAIFVYALVEWHRDMPGRVQEQRVALRSAGNGTGTDTSTLGERIRPVGQVHMERTEPEPAAPAKTTTATAAPVRRDGQQVYQMACVACHGAGIAGAPKVGDKGQWTRRAAKGVNTLYRSALKGLQTSAGVMPAKGGNPALSDAEVRAAVDYMLAQSK